MDEPAQRHDHYQDGENRMSFIPKPIGEGTSNGRRQIIDNAIGKFWLGDRALQIDQRNCTKQSDAHPIIYSLHRCWMAGSAKFGKSLRYSLLVGAVFISASCSDNGPIGQALATIDGQEVTQRELQEVTAAMQRQNGTGQVNEAAAFEALIDRKILAAEALKRGLDQEGAFHFALRQERERLLVEALRRDLTSKSPAIDAASIDAFIKAQPWRFDKRFLLSLTRTNTDGERLELVLDSWNYFSKPPEDVISASEGDLLEIAGKEWTSTGRSEQPIVNNRAVNLAKAELRKKMHSDHLRQIISNHRQSGQIRYQEGYGPTAQ